MAISDKERIEGLLKVADFNIARFDERRNHSWKIALAFWAAILASATVLRSLEARPPLCYIIAAGTIVLALHSYWLFRVFQADKKDKLLAFRARDIAIALLRTELAPPPFDIEKATLIKDWSVQFQFSTTLFLTAAAVYLANSP